LVEFCSEYSIRERYPNGVRDLADGGTHNTIAGQPTDDSEMALMLARSIVWARGYDRGEAAVAYALWLGSAPFDYGVTTEQALTPALDALDAGRSPADVALAAQRGASRESQANGALMRVSPLGILAHGLTADTAAELARKDASLTHPHPICQDANAVFVVALAHAIATGSAAEETYAFVTDWMQGADESATRLHRKIEPSIIECLHRAATAPPPDFQHQQGWVLTALRNAFWQLLHAPGLEAGICDTVMRGGDTDTNAAIAGALLGAVHGSDAIPARWRNTILSCRPEKGRPGVHRPRPKPLWPADAITLAHSIVEIGSDNFHAQAVTLDRAPADSTWMWARHGSVRD
jgi:ADP-ribosylglycohydrolase